MKQYWDRMSDGMKVVITLVTLVTTIAGAAVAFDIRYVDEKEAVQSIQQLEQTFELKQNVTQYQFYKEQYFDARREFRNNPNDPIAKDEYEYYKKKVEELERKIEAK